MTKIKTVDGEGSGLDADTLDGKHLIKTGNWDKIPLIGADGAMEVGGYIDFHVTSTGSTDYDGRLSCFSGIAYWGLDKMYHEGNSNRTDINWSAATLTANTDILLNSITATDKSVKNFINAFNNAFDLTGGVIKAKQNLYSVGEITAYSTGAGVLGLKLMADMNANGKKIIGASSVSAGDIVIGNDPLGFLGGDSPGLYNAGNDGIIAAYNYNAGNFYYANGNLIVDYSGVTTPAAMKANEFKFGLWSFKEVSGNMVIYYNGTAKATIQSSRTNSNL